MQTQTGKRPLRPFLKWAGGKRYLAHTILAHVPDEFGTYYEPFVGGGAVLFALQPERAVINDRSRELINCYKVLKNERRIKSLIEVLGKHRNDETCYYRIRSLDRSPSFKGLSAVEKAARVIYLNKTCYNGLFRVNSRGQFNVPFGRYANPKILDQELLLAVGQYLREHDVRIHCTDFARIARRAQAGDFVYFDPPYHPVSDTSFTGYDLTGFGEREQRRLKRLFDRLTAKGCYCMLSNSATPFIRDLYEAYAATTITVSVPRAINSRATGRGKVEELLVMNYHPATRRERQQLSLIES
jgi:DNA adenine methylase